MKKIVLLPGDCIGPEIALEARRVLEHLAPDVALEERPFGASAIREFGTPLPQETLDASLAADAVLKGPVGDPEFDAADVRPEQGLLALRKALDVYANLRPARAPGISDADPFSCAPREHGRRQWSTAPDRRRDESRRVHRRGPRSATSLH